MDTTISNGCFCQTVSGCPRLQHICCVTNICITNQLGKFGILVAAVDLSLS